MHLQPIILITANTFIRSNTTYQLLRILNLQPGTICTLAKAKGLVWRSLIHNSFTGEGLNQKGTAHIHCLVAYPTTTILGIMGTLRGSFHLSWHEEDIGDE